MAVEASVRCPPSSTANEFYRTMLMILIEKQRKDQQRCTAAGSHSCKKRGVDRTLPEGGDLLSSIVATPLSIATWGVFLLDSLSLRPRRQVLEELSASLRWHDVLILLYPFLSNEEQPTNLTAPRTTRARRKLHESAVIIPA